MTEEYEPQKDNKLKYKNTIDEKKDVAAISVQSKKRKWKSKNVK